MSAAQILDDEHAVQQRTVAASDAPPVHTAAVASVFHLGGTLPTPAPCVDEGSDSAAPAAQPPPDLNPFTSWRRPGSAAPAPDLEAAAENPAEDDVPMKKQTPGRAAKAKRRPRPTKAASPQFQICALLLAKGKLTREQLLEDVSADRIAFTNGLFNAKAGGRIAFDEAAGAYRLTDIGKEWVSGGANLAQQKATKADVPPPHGEATCCGEEVEGAPPHARAQGRAGRRRSSAIARGDGGGYASNRRHTAVVSLRRVQRRRLPPGQGRPGDRPHPGGALRNAPLSRAHGRTGLTPTTGATQ